ncbi:uncharacterized protein BDW70DRAFT_136528 [Aspergillus foveolatus]|uniref:uncharacterized protein n=1 Tax=Aspergillus foveolatus TaxID=210207 RepID=UPI003CCCF6DF
MTLNSINLTTLSKKNEHEYTIPGDPARTVKIRLFLTDEGMNKSGWMKNFVVECNWTARQFSQDEKGDGEDQDLVHGSNEAFERAWTLHALVSPGILTADAESQLVGKSAKER